MSDPALAAAVVLASAGADALELAGLAGDPQTLALRDFAGDVGLTGDLIAAISAADEHSTWAGYVESDWARRLADRSAAATIVGPRGPIRRADLTFGFYRVGPHAIYPKHGHPARELYLIVSGHTEFLTADGWRTLGPGQASVQEPGVVHALRTADEPILCFWVWTGDVDSPIWGIDENGDRFFPERSER